jgi:hypothetical protein
MDFLFGANSAQNQHVRKTGTEYILSRIWNASPNGVWLHFDVPSFPPFWKGATLRSAEAPGLKVGTPFLFGRMVSGLDRRPARPLHSIQIPSIHDLNFHSFSSPLSDRLHRCELAASMVCTAIDRTHPTLTRPHSQLHTLMHYHAIIPLTPRRPRRPDLEMDWVGLIVGGSTLERPEGELVRFLPFPSFDLRLITLQILRELLINIDALVPPGQDYQGPIKYDEYPHMKAIVDKTITCKCADICSTPAWDSIIGFVATFRVPVPGTAFRSDAMPSDSSSEGDTENDEGEDEQPVKTAVRPRAETSKAGQGRPPPGTNAGRRTRPRSSPEPAVGESHLMPIDLV